MPLVTTTVLRNEQNFWSALVINALILPGLWLLTDPLDVVPWNERLPDQLGFSQAIAVHIGFTVVAVGSWSLFLAPKVVFSGQRIVVVNPMSRWEVPVPAVAGVRHHVLHALLLLNDGKQVRLWSLEWSPTMSGLTKQFEDLVAAEKGRRVTTTTSDVVRRWGIHRGALATGGAWLIVLTCSLLAR